MTITKFSKQFILASLLFVFGFILHVQTIKVDKMAKKAEVQNFTTKVASSSK
jgi:hypothetical protein